MDYINPAMDYINPAFETESVGEHNYFYCGDNSKIHIIINKTLQPRLLICFPAGNSGIGLFSDSDAKKMRVRNICEYSKNDLFGVRFILETDGEETGFSQIKMESLRYFRDYEQGNSFEAYDSAKTRFLSLIGKNPERYRVICKKAPNGSIQAEKSVIDDKNRYFLEIHPIEGQGRITGENAIMITNITSRKASLEITAAVSFERVRGYEMQALFRDKIKIVDSDADNSSIPSDLSIKSLAFLSSKDKFMAGSWRYLTYFGRDTILSLLMLKDALSSDAFQAGLQSVINRLSPDGRVAHEEDIGEMAIHQRISCLIDRMSPDEIEKTHFSSLSLPVYDYKMVDDDFLFPIMLDSFIFDDSVENREKADFLRKRNQNHDNLYISLMNINHILMKSIPFMQKNIHTNLIRIPRSSMVGDWRDSESGLGYGVYPGSVNVFIVKASLRACQRLMDIFHYLLRDNFNSYLKTGLLKNIDYVMESENLWNDLISPWEKAGELFRVEFNIEQIRENLGYFLDNNNYGGDLLEYCLSREIDGKKIIDFVEGNRNIRELKNGIRFFSLSLDSKGKPVKVMNGDFCFDLFLGNPDDKTINEYLEIINLPYPLGLGTPGGILSANSSLCGKAEVINALGPKAYHGAVIWSWQSAMIKMGLIKQKNAAANPHTTNEIEKTLKRINRIEQNIGSIINSEVWTFGIKDGHPEFIPLGSADSGHETFSNPIQLWSTVRINK